MTTTQVWDTYLEGEQLDEDIAATRRELAQLAEEERSLADAIAHNTPLLEKASAASQAAMEASRNKWDLLASLEEEEQALTQRCAELSAACKELEQSIEYEFLAGRELLRVAKALEAYRDIWRPYLERDEKNVLKLASKLSRKDRNQIPALVDGKSSVDLGEWSDLTMVLAGVAAKRNAIASDQVEA